MPVTPPRPTGRKNKTFSLKFFVRWAKKEISRSYMPKTAANAPPLTPGKINPEPINIPFTNRNIQSLVVYPTSWFSIFCLFSTICALLLSFNFIHDWTFPAILLKDFFIGLYYFFIHFDNIRIKHVTSIMIEIAAIVKQGLDPPISVLFPFLIS